jgi:hypothetical protein
MYSNNRAKSDLYIHMGPSNRSAQVFERFSFDEQDPPSIRSNRSWMSSLFLRKKTRPKDRFQWMKSGSTSKLSWKWYDSTPLDPRVN